MKTQYLDPVHPGEVLKEDFLAPMGLTPHRLARDLGVPPIRISEVVRGLRGISADTALRLARYFGTSAEVWMGLQADYDLRVTARHSRKRIEREVTPCAMAA